MMRTFFEYVLGGFLFGYFVNLGGAWYVGRLWKARMPGADNRRLRLSGFSVPDRLVWPLIVAWAVVLVGRVAPLGILSAIALNVGMVLLAVFGLQGLGIAGYLADRNPTVLAFRRFWLLGLALALVIPRLAVLLLVGIPAVGVSEIWVKYRSHTEGESDEGDS